MQRQQINHAIPCRGLVTFQVCLYRFNAKEEYLTSFDPVNPLLECIHAIRCILKVYPVSSGSFSSSLWHRQGQTGLRRDIIGVDGVCGHLKVGLQDIVFVPSRQRSHGTSVSHLSRLVGHHADGAQSLYTKKTLFLCSTGKITSKIPSLTTLPWATCNRDSIGACTCATPS